MLERTLKEARQSKGITQAELADVLGITQQGVARWENGKSNPTLETLITLADFFGVSTDSLLGRTGMKNVLFNEEEKKLVAGYRTLDKAKRQTLCNMLAFLTSPQGANTGNVVQKNKNGHNLYTNNGNNVVLA